MRTKAGVRTTMPSEKSFETRLEGGLRQLAGRTSRRGLLSRLGLALVAAPVFPVLPVSRASAKDRSGQAKTAFARHAQTSDDTQCDYWRYCAIDGSLCTCCGGSLHTCPPGTEPSPTTWVGTCINPDDSRAYLVAYRDRAGAQTARDSDSGAQSRHPQGHSARPTSTAVEQ